MPERIDNNIAINKTRLAIASVLIIPLERALFGETPDVPKVAAYLLTAAAGLFFASRGLNEINESGILRTSTLSGQTRSGKANPWR